MNNPYCHIHKIEMEFKEGDSKTKVNEDGSPKHWKGYFCTEKGCEIKEWINEGKKNYKKPQPLMTDEQYQNIMNALRKVYALIESKK